MFDRFTDRARKIMGLSRQEAQRFRHQYIGTEHLLLGMIQEHHGIASHALRNLDVSTGRVQAEVEKIVMSGPEVVPNPAQMPFTPRAKKVLELAAEEASNMKLNYIGTEHILLGLIREGEGVAGQILLNLGLTPERVRAEVLDLLGVTVLEPQAPAVCAVTRFVAFVAPAGSFCPVCAGTSVELRLHEGGQVKWVCCKPGCAESKR